MPALGKGTHGRQKTGNIAKHGVDASTSNKRALPLAGSTARCSRRVALQARAAFARSLHRRRTKAYMLILSLKGLMRTGLGLPWRGCMSWVNAAAQVDSNVSKGHGLAAHTHIHAPFRRLTTASMYFSSASYQSWFIVRAQPYTLRYLQGVSMMGAQQLVHGVGRPDQKVASGECTGACFFKNLRKLKCPMPPTPPLPAVSTDRCTGSAVLAT